MKTIHLPADALVILIAPAGSGKSTFARTHFRTAEIVSSDRCRALVADDEADQRATGPAFDVFDAIVRGRLCMGRLTVADATNLEPVPRQRLREMARAHGRPAIAIVIDVPLSIAQSRNLARDRQVPPHVVESHYDRFGIARDALAAEGYDALYELQPEVPVQIVRVGTTHEKAPA